MCHAEQLLPPPGQRSVWLRSGAQSAEDYLKRRLGLRMTVNTKQILEEAQVQGYPAEVMRRAINAMLVRSELTERNQGKLLMRIK